ncbi:hypothetical protein E4U41_000494 [Claviceps citrina]|nr:hypothetical protein E4U41_000494 [Claviceps citrina]
MPYFKSSQEWLEKSSLLIEARPETTRITTRYSIKAVPPRLKAPPADGAQTSDAHAAAAAAAAAVLPESNPKPPRGSLVLTTYDPVSGVNLKYRTTKAAEVTRLVQSALGRLGRCMAGLPAEPPEEAMPDAPPIVAAADQGLVDSAAKQKSGGGGGGAAPVQPGQAAHSGGGKKKKGRR